MSTSARRPPTLCADGGALEEIRRRREATASCAATPARCCAASGPGAPAPASATPTTTARWCASIRWCCCSATVDEGGTLVPNSPAANGTARCSIPSRTFVTGIGAGTTYPDYKPAPFIVSAEHDGVDTVTVVTEGIFSYCGVKVKIDTDRHLGPETAAIRAEGEQVGHVTTAEYGSQMLSIGGVRHLTGGSQEGRQRHLRHAAQAVHRRGGRADASTAATAWSCRPASAPVVDGRPEERMRVGCGSATVGIFAQQWLGHVDEVIVVDDHITGVLTEHQAGRVLDMRAGRHPRARAQVDAGPLLPGRQSGPRLGRHRHHRSAGDHPEDRSRRWRGRACAC